MKILIAPNAFKGSLSVHQACRVLSAGVKSALPGARISLMPISDGGDGLIDALLAEKGGRLVSVSVLGPMGERRTAQFAWLPGRIAVVEMARASGLALVPPAKRDVMRATSYGTGQLIDAALRRGARTVIVGLGGSATSDGGAGMAQALGARLLGEDGRELERGARALLGLERIESGALRRRLKGARVIAVSDVTNPLVGPAGSARTYGPQKGATRAQVRTLEMTMIRYARILKRDVGKEVSRLAGSGAAGGLGAGLAAFLGAKIVPGAAFVLAQIGALKKLESAGAALTGEGRLDRTSFFGKAPIEFTRLARSAGVPVALVCGRIEPAVRAKAGVAVSLADAGARGDEAMKRATFWARKAAALAIKRLLLASVAAVLFCATARPESDFQMKCRAALPGSAEISTYCEIDDLYFHRNEPGKLDASVFRLEGLVRDKPHDPELLWRLGRSILRDGERRASKDDQVKTFQRAEDVLRRSVELAPRVAVSHFWLGVAMGRRGQARGVMNSLFIISPFKKEMRTVLEIDPKYGGAHNALGQMYWQLPMLVGGSKRKAIAEFESALSLSPDHAANYVALAVAYSDTGRKDEARAVLDKLFALKDPADPAAYAECVRQGRELEGKLGR